MGKALAVLSEVSLPLTLYKVELPRGDFAAAFKYVKSE